MAVSGRVHSFLSNNSELPKDKPAPFLSLDTCPGAGPEGIARILSYPAQSGKGWFIFHWLHGGSLKRRRKVTREITIETTETVSFRPIETEENTVVGTIADRSTILAWCPSCRRQVEMVTPEQAAKIANVSTRAIYRWTEAEVVHFIHESERALVICRDSLASLRAR
jgi:hypothetical protein